MKNSEPTVSASADTNKQMLEIKKKIQLSEGQRKAAFEDCEAERKANIEEIHKLKKDIRELVKELKEKTQTTAGLRPLSKKLEDVVGPYEGKGVEEIKELIDLQIIDKCKALNLIQYKIRKRQNFLAELGKEYQTLLSRKSFKQVVEKVDKPTRRATCDLQNSIHAVEIQLREANHISVRYRDIKKSLLEDAARFESNIKKIEEQLEEQNTEINGLQQIMNEATRKKGTARGHLLREEKLAMSSANSRQRQTAEGHRLVTKRKQELELLEKRIFQVTKSQMRPSTGNDDAAAATDEEIIETPTPPEDVLSRSFDVLKQATGATSTEEVLHKFSAQKETLEKLIALRMKAEDEKNKLEKDLEELTARLEYFKYAEVKESQKKSAKMEQINALIEEEHNRSQKALAVKSMKEKTIQTILVGVRELYLCINPLAIPGTNILTVLEQMNADLKIVLEKMHTEENIENGEENAVIIEGGLEEKWLPAPYSGLVRRTPLPQPGASPAPPPPTASEDEEEVPSRTYLKRQAQLVVDAKSRRKNVRVPQKRN